MAIESLRGEECIVSLPEYTDLDRLTFVKDGEDIRPKIYEKNGERVINLTKHLQKGEKIYIHGGNAEGIYTQSEINKNFKSCGSSRLGTPKTL